MEHLSLDYRDTSKHLHQNLFLIRHHHTHLAASTPYKCKILTNQLISPIPSPNNGLHCQIPEMGRNTQQKSL